MERNVKEISKTLAVQWKKNDTLVAARIDYGDALATPC